MRPWILAAAVLTPAVLGCATVEEDVAPPRGELAVHGRQLSFGLGARSFEDDDFTRLDDQTAFTLDYCEVLGLGALRLEGGLHYASDDDESTLAGQEVDSRSEVFEPSVGLNYTLRVGRLRPYVGLGVGLQFLEVRGIDEAGQDVFDDDDVAAGAYWKGGLLLQVTPTSHVGVEYRHLEGQDVRLDGTDLDTSYDQLLIVFGTSFFRGPRPRQDQR
jgi:opacity protein-like surface antigen